MTPSPEMTPSGGSEGQPPRHHRTAMAASSDLFQLGDAELAPFWFVQQSKCESSVRNHMDKPRLLRLLSVDEALYHSVVFLYHLVLKGVGVGKVTSCRSFIPFQHFLFPTDRGRCLSVYLCSGYHGVS